MTQFSSARWQQAHVGDAVVWHVSSFRHCRWLAVELQQPGQVGSDVGTVRLAVCQGSSPLDVSHINMRARITGPLSYI